MPYNIAMVSNQPQPEELLPAVKQLALEASQRILEIYESSFVVEQKEDCTPLTQADLASHEAICAGLRSLAPDIPVLSEESADIAFSARKDWYTLWLVDPLDGTREFIKRNGEFTINIALISANAPILGVVHAPVTGVCYFAAKNHGAYKQSGNETPCRINARRTRPGHMAVTGSRSHSSARQQALIKRLGDIEVHAIGSALKFCLVAEGLVDLYPRFGPTSEWDTAAGQCLVEEAGGLVTGFDLEPLRYNTKESLLNPEFLAISDKSFDWQPYLRDL